MPASRPAELAEPEAPTRPGGADTPAGNANLRRLGLAGIVWAYFPVVLISRGSFRYLFEDQVLRNWSTIFVSVVLQALPFLVLGVAVSATVSALVPAAWLARAVPGRPMLAVPTAGLAGAVLPGCECSSVPVARRLVARGVPAGAALTFLLAAPAINPVVIVATAVAFPGQPEVVLARFVASLLAAVTVGGIWTRFAGRDHLRVPEDEHDHDHRGRAFVGTATADLLQAGGYLVAGAGLVATLQTLVPTSVFERLGGSGVTAVLVLAVLAVLLSICSEADAFVAAGLSQFSLTARLAFLVVGPMVDLKLIALQVGAFGRGFALRFAPLTFVTAVLAASLVGLVLL